MSSTAHIKKELLVHIRLLFHLCSDTKRMLKQRLYTAVIVV